MVKYIVGVLVLICLALVSVYFFVGVPRVYREDFKVWQTPHYYGDPSQSIENIEVIGIYFVPKNRADIQIENWESVLKRSLDDLVEFHEKQFLGRSSVSYRLYPEPIVGLKENTGYDSPLPRHTNLEALEKVFAEIEERVFRVSGDKYISAVSTTGSESYRVVMIMYEGVGDLGTDGVAMLPRSFLTRPDFQEFSSSFFAHEFYHTLGVPDQYYESFDELEGGHKVEIGFLTSEDVMGRAQISLERTYLDSDTLHAMGI